MLNTLLAGVAVTTMSMVSAHAAILDEVAGNIQFQFSGWDAAQVAYDTSAIADGAYLCANAADCDTASSILGDPAAPGAAGTDDTYGLARINSIIDQNTLGNLWSDGDNGDVLLAYFHDFTDEAVVRISATDTELYSIGGVADIYRIDAATFASVDRTDQSTIEADLAALIGDLYLHLEFQPGCDLIETYATLCGDFDLTTSTGNSSAYAIATGGSAVGKYPYEFLFTQDVRPCNIASCNNTSFNIFVRGGEADTIALPEPGTLGLLGLGLVGLGLAGRRRKA